MLNFEDTKHCRHGTARFKEEREEDLSSLEDTRQKFLHEEVDSCEPFFLHEKPGRRTSCIPKAASFGARVFVGKFIFPESLVVVPTNHK